MAHGSKYFRRKGRDSGKGAFELGVTDRIANGENTRVKDTDDIPRIGFVHNRAVLCHELLWLCKLNFLAALHVIHITAALKLT